MNDTERLVKAAEDLTAALEKLADHMAESAPQPPETSTDPGESVPDELDPVDTLRAHMQSHGVATHFVEFRDLDNHPDRIWFKEMWDEMTDAQLAAFRDYTQESDHVEVHDWREVDGNHYPDGFEVAYEDLEGLL